MRLSSAAHTSLLLAAALLGLPAPAAGQSEATVIQNATIFTVSGPTIERGSVLIRDGKIAAVGESVQAPRGATVVDATGLYVIPGIVDCHSHVAMDDSLSNEGSIAVSSMVQVEEILNPDDINIYRELAGGVTSNVLHGSANPIGGLNAVIKMRWGKDAKGLLFDGAPPGIKFALGENPTRANRPSMRNRYPNTRMGVMDVIRRSFIEAREYQKEWEAYRQRQDAGEENLIPPRPEAGATGGSFRG
jgi:imidazolonepropionase-like amidohydrolase